MALPNNVTTITVTGQYIDFSGSPIAGQVKFSNPEFLINPTADRIIVPTTITATLDNTGAFSVVIPITNDADLTPLNFTYTFEESFIGGSTFTISLPASLGGTVDISDLRTTAVVENYYQPASYNLYPQLEARVEVEEDSLDVTATITNTTYAGLTAKRGTYAGLAANTSPSTYAQTSVGVSWTYAQVQTFITQLNLALTNTGTLTDPYLSITRTNTDGSYGALALQGAGTYAYLASTYATYAASTGAVFTFTYRDTADTIRDEANRINTLMLIGAKR